MKTKTWILLISVLFVLFGALAAFFMVFRRANTVQIEQDGKVLRTIALDGVYNEETFVIQAPDGGSNTVTVQPGRICVSEADCPDKLCQKRGWLTTGAPIVCLPHRLVIRCIGTVAADAAAQ